VTTERIPTKIGRYEIRKELGRGMMGVVYEAGDPSLNRTIALKVIRLIFAVSDQEQESFERRFLSEARIAARLTHPGIVIVHDVGRDPDTGVLYIALERLAGSTLAEITAEGRRLPWREALRIVARVAEALHYAHAQGIVHRDIKPANIMVLPGGEPKIMDFGLAKHEAGHELTASGQFVGTPLFMAPEQVLGLPVDGRTDLFSLGSVAYTILTGTRPFAAESVPRIMTRVAHQDPVPPSRSVPDLPPEVDYLVARAMAKAPSDRYPDGKAMAEDAEDILAGRPPRHRAGWTLPPPAEGTLVAARPNGEAPGVLDLEPITEEAAGKAPSASASAAGAASAPVRRRGVRPLRILALGMLLAGLGVYYSAFYESDRLADALRPLVEVLSPWLEPTPPATGPAPGVLPRPIGEPGGQRSPSPDAPGPSGPSPAADSVTAGSLATTAPPESPLPSPPSTEPPAPPPTLSRPSPEPSAPSPSPSPEAVKKSPPAAKAPGQLAVHMEHHLKSGTVRVWLDEKLVVEEVLDARVTKKILFFNFRKGVVQEMLKVSPGKHDLRVQVKWDDNVETRRISGTFRPGATRHLEIGISRLGGDLSVAWK
jgi:serine/threonine-protein kinase